MLRTRVLPCLLLADGSLVKTVRFRDAKYVGDPINAVRIFNELEVDELVILDIKATAETKDPDFGLIQELSEECFMPLSYGGGIRTLNQARRILALGVEKLIMNSSAITKPSLLADCAAEFGRQSVMASVDARRYARRGYRVVTDAGRQKLPITPAEHAAACVRNGAGEILLTSIDRDGTWTGYDLELLTSVTSAVDVPIIVSGGAGKLQDLLEAARLGASGVALGSMAVFQKMGLGVLVNFPSREILEDLLDGVQVGRL